MCGLSGFIGLSISDEQKCMLVIGLAKGIDDRGGHAAGYVSITNKDGKDDMRYNRKSGEWIRSRMRFIMGACGDMCLMHARFSTCGNRDNPDNAHPFAIRRNGRVVMWGAHNGMIPDAWESAKRHGRNINVDSQEIFELLADQEYEAIQKMSGYGVITWIDADNKHYINLTRLSKDSDICVVSIKGGGIIWASTWKILSAALKFAELEAEYQFDVSDVGRVYQLRANGVFQTNIENICLSSFTRTSYRSNYDVSRYDNNSVVTDQMVKETLCKTNTPGTGSYNGWKASNYYE